MRRLYGWMAGCAVLVMLVGGCGSTGGGTDGDDALVVRLVEFNGDGLMQADAVLPNNAQIDVVRHFCVTSGGDTGEVMISNEPFTETVVNAVLRNDQRLDIRLNRMKLHFSDQRVGFGDIESAINGTVVGGRCSSAPDRSCATSAECTVGLTQGNCNFSETTVTGLLLIDFAAKEAVEPSLFTPGEGTPATITFYGSDVVGNSYQVTAGYTVTFANFCNCGSDEICCETLEECIIF